MQTLSQMDDSTLLTWAREFIGLELGTTIGKKAGTPETIKFNLGELPAVSATVLMLHGAQRKVNDATTSAGGAHGEKVKAARKMVEQLKTGVFGRTPGATVDAFQVILLRVIRRRLKAKKPELVKQIDEMDAKAAERELMAIFNKQSPEKQTEIKNEASVIRKQQEELAAIRATADVDTDDL